MYIKKKKKKKEYQELAASITARRRQGKHLPDRHQIKHGTADNWMLSFGLPNYEAKYFCCFKPPSFWYFVSISNPTKLIHTHLQMETFSTFFIFSHKVCSHSTPWVEH